MYQFMLPLLGLAVMVAAQLISVRFISLLKSVYIGFAAGIVFVLFGHYFVFSANMLDALASFGIDAITFGALAYCYFHFINLGETARRIRIMREFYDEPISYEQLLAKYNAAAIVKVRLKRLINNGQVIEESGRYRIGNPSVLLMAKIMVMLKIMFLGRAGEKLNNENEK